jgi:hypothetical protein
MNANRKEAAAMDSELVKWLRQNRRAEAEARYFGDEDKLNVLAAEFNREYERRVDQLEEEGLTTSDAQAAADAELLAAGR